MSNISSISSQSRGHSPCRSVTLAALPASASSFRPEGLGAGVAARPSRLGGAFCATMPQPARNPAFGVEKAISYHLFLKTNSTVTGTKTAKGGFSHQPAGAASGFPRLANNTKWHHLTSLLAVLALSTLLLIDTSCSSSNYDYYSRPDLPKTEMATLELGTTAQTGAYVASIDGKDVHVKFMTERFYLAPGLHTVELYYYAQETLYNAHIGTRQKVTFTAEPGKIYCPGCTISSERRRSRAPNEVIGADETGLQWSAQIIEVARPPLGFFPKTDYGPYNKVRTVGTSAP